ncbi:MAG: hypothetical protein KDD64_14055 [Bdellovibrionales bacterium]|nr:hypothetical protein [Bdellovibrionales bacterium]
MQPISLRIFQFGLELRVMKIGGTLVSVTITLLLGAFVNPACADPAQVVARTGQSAVGVSGYTYNGLFRDNVTSPVTALPAPMMAGDLVALFSSLNQGGSAPASDRGLWLLHQNGSGRVVARQGSSAAGTEQGTIFQTLSDMTTDSYGRVFYFASLAGPAITQGLNSSGVWEADMSQSALTLRVISSAPGTGPNGYFRTVNNVQPLDGSLGSDLAITAVVTSYPGQPVTLPYTTGIWARSGAAFEMVSWSYGDVPGLSSTWFANGYHQIGPAGRGATAAQMYGPNISSILVNGTTITNDWVVLRTAPGSREIIARTATQAPGTDAGVMFRTLPGSTTLPAVNAAGDFVFAARLIGPGVTTSNSTGLWRSSTSEVSLLARGGAPALAAGTGVNFDSLVANSSDGSLSVMDNGDAVFVTYFSGAGITLNNLNGIYKLSPTGQHSLIARSGVPQSGLPNGTTFLRTAMPLAMKTAGEDHVMFVSRLAGTGVTTANDDVLFRHREASGLQLIAREGDVIGDHVLKSFVGNGADMQLTGNGYAIVSVTLSPTSNPTATPQPGVLGISPSGSMQVIAAKGSSISLSDNTSPTISDLRLAPKNALSDGGKVAIAAMFTGTPRDEAVFVASIDSAVSCPADFNHDGTVSNADLFAFLSAWFAQSMSADFDGSGDITVPDIFEFLAVWFEGC